MAQQQVKFEFDSEIESPVIFTAIEGMHLFRVVQESINNSLKYANATLIKVHFNEHVQTKNQVKSEHKETKQVFTTMWFLTILRLLYWEGRWKNNTDCGDSGGRNNSPFSHRQLGQWRNCHVLSLLLLLKEFDHNNATGLRESAGDNLAHPDILNNCLQLIDEGVICRMFER